MVQDLILLEIAAGVCPGRREWQWEEHCCEPFVSWGGWGSWGWLGQLRQLRKGLIRVVWGSNWVLKLSTVKHGHVQHAVRCTALHRPSQPLVTFPTHPPHHQAHSHAFLTTHKLGQNVLVFSPIFIRFHPFSHTGSGFMTPAQASSF